MLERFSWKKSNLANCRCPICGDSQKNKSKARGFFYQKSNSYFYKCHNCSYGCNLYNFLKQVSSQLAKEYSLERWKSGEDKNKTPQKEKNMFGLLGKKPEFKKKDKALDSLQCLTSLPDDHVVVKFANMRIIPKQHWKYLYFSEDFGNLMREFDPTVPCVGKEERLVIPFFNKNGDVVAIQGRSLNFRDESNARKTAKYITVKADKSIERLWYGMWRTKPEKRIYVVEGPIDSMFLQNSVAMVGAGALEKIPNRFKDSPMTFILDNEPRNLQICKYNQKLIDMGKDVCIWPENIQEKDINDLAYRLSTRKIQKMIDENTVRGLEANLKLKAWRKV
tara:strand:+ start:2105 stop:3109 length:1005 start_codon:yes stop_codon:yes gene_type:complete